MTGDKRPAFQFYPDDWKADDDLMSCSLAAQGLWVYILCVMHHRTPYGHLVTRSGEPMPVKRLAKLTGSTAEEVDALLIELNEMGVYSQTDTGVIYSRRMVYDFERYEERAASGRRGGLATATARAEAIAGRELPADVEANGQRELEQDSHTPSPSPSPSPTPDSRLQTAVSTSAAADSAFINTVMQFWEDHGLKPNVKSISQARRSAILARKNEYGGSAVIEALQKRADSRFLCHEFADGRGAAIDWVMGPKNFVKVRDGNYTDDALGEDADGWVVETYRATDFTTFGTHEKWKAYLDYAVEVAPRTAEPFETWLEGEHTDAE